MSQKRKFKDQRVSRNAFKSQRIALEGEGFSFSQASNMFKSAQAREIPSQQIYKEDVFKYGGDIENDYNAPGRLSDSIRNPSAEPDDYDKVLRLVPRDMFKASVLESKKTMSDFYIKNRLREVGADGKVSFVDKDGDGKADTGISMQHPATTISVGKASFNGARLLQQAEGNYLRNINMFKQPRFEFRSDDEFRLAAGHKTDDTLAHDFGPGQGDPGDDADDEGGVGGGSNDDDLPALCPSTPTVEHPNSGVHAQPQHASVNTDRVDGIEKFQSGHPRGVKPDKKQHERKINHLTQVAGVERKSARKARREGKRRQGSVSSSGSVDGKYGSMSRNSAPGSDSNITNTGARSFIPSAPSLAGVFKREYQPSDVFAVKREREDPGLHSVPDAGTTQSYPPVASSESADFLRKGLVSRRGRIASDSEAGPVMTRARRMKNLKSSLEAVSTKSSVIMSRGLLGDIGTGVKLKRTPVRTPVKKKETMMSRLRKKVTPVRSRLAKISSDSGSDFATPAPDARTLRRTARTEFTTRKEAKTRVKREN